MVFCVFRILTAVFGFINTKDRPEGRSTTLSYHYYIAAAVAQIMATLVQSITWISLMFHWFDITIKLHKHRRYFRWTTIVLFSCLAVALIATGINAGLAPEDSYACAFLAVFFVLILIALFMAVITAYVGCHVVVSLRATIEQNGGLVDSRAHVLIKIAALFAFSCVVMLVCALGWHAYGFAPMPLACHIGAAGGYGSSMALVWLTNIIPLLPSFLFMTFMWQSGVSQLDRQATRVSKFEDYITNDMDDEQPSALGIMSESHGQGGVRLFRNPSLTSQQEIVELQLT